MDRTDWVLSNPAQIVLNGSQASTMQRFVSKPVQDFRPFQVFWTSEVEDAFDSGTVGSREIGPSRAVDSAAGLASRLREEALAADPGFDHASPQGGGPLSA